MPTAAQEQKVEARTAEERGRDEFEAFFLSHWRRSVALAAALAEEGQEAEDAAQEAFLRLYPRFACFASDEERRAWLWRVVVNLASNARRSQRRRREREARLARLGYAQKAAWEESQNPEALALTAERREMARRALWELGERDRCLLLLRHWGASYKEVACALGVSSASVGALLARAEERFQKVWARLYKEGG